MNAPQVALRQLAQAAGLQTSSVDILGHQHRVSPEVILAALNAPDIDIATIEQAPAALYTFQHQRLVQRIEPTIVMRPDRRNALSVFLPSSSEPERSTVFLHQEDGVTYEWSVRAAELPRKGQEHNGTDTDSIARLELPTLPTGYHTLSLHLLDGIETITHILCAPVHGWLPAEEGWWWGIFLAQRNGQLGSDADEMASMCVIQWRSSLLYSPLSHNVPKQYSLAKVVARCQGACVIRCAAIISSACPSCRWNSEGQASQRLRRAHSPHSTRTICCHLQHFGNHGRHTSTMQRSAGSSAKPVTKGSFATRSMVYRS